MNGDTRIALALAHAEIAAVHIRESFPDVPEALICSCSDRPGQRATVYQVLQDGCALQFEDGILVEFYAWTEIVNWKDILAAYAATKTVRH